MSARFGLADCNNFYASCEKAFDPRLRDKPVVVLSNNDGNVIARSEEAKALGVEMCEVAFMRAPFYRQKGVAVLSSNYALYQDLSNRVMSTLSRFAPVEVYSIDESFLGLEGAGQGDLTPFGRELRATVRRWTGIPISLGIAPTKTLAKLANAIAKKNPDMDGVLDLSDHPHPEDLLASFPVEKIWGVGPAFAERFKRRGINTALALRDADEGWIRKRLHKPGLQIVYELRGISCLPLESVPSRKKSITSSRSFGRTVRRLEELKEAVAYHCTRAAERMRSGGLRTKLVQVWIGTDPHDPARTPYYGRTGSAKLEIASSYTPELVQVAHKLLEQIYRPGLAYKRTGITFSQLLPGYEAQLSLFHSREENEKQDKLMATVDKLNRKFGRDTVYLGAMEKNPTWRLRSARHSPRYTTCWGELPQARLPDKGDREPFSLWLPEDLDEEI